MAIVHAGHLHSLFNSQSPSDDIDDGTPDIEVLGAEASLGLNINYKTLIITGIVFMLIVSWLDFIQTAFYFWYKPDIDDTDIGPAGVFWFCVLVTILGVLIIVALTLW